jgi:hypothetical protein
MTVSDRIRIKDVRLLSDNHYVLKTTTFEYRRSDDAWPAKARTSRCWSLRSTRRSP